MSETLYADYSIARPDPHTLAATFAAVMRYLSGGLTINGLPKDVSTPEASSLHAAGLGIGVVWETSAARANQGFGAGAADSKAANAQADALGIPRSVPIFYCGQDSGTPNIPAVVDYFRGVAYVNTRGVGCYGGIDVVNAVAASNWAHWFWQTEAWSGTNISPHAHLYQRARATKPVAGCDENVLIQPFPLWLPSDAKPFPVPAPAPVPVHTNPAPTQPKGLNVQTIDLRNASNSHLVTGPGVAPMQRLLGMAVIDGKAGDMTRHSLGAAQIRIFGKADYEFGPATAEALLAGR